MVTDLAHVPREIRVRLVPRLMHLPKILQMTTGLLRRVEPFVVRAARSAQTVDVLAELPDQLESTVRFRNESRMEGTNPSDMLLQVQPSAAMTRGHMQTMSMPSADERTHSNAIRT